MCVCVCVCVCVHTHAYIGIQKHGNSKNVSTILTDKTLTRGFFPKAQTYKPTDLEKIDSSDRVTYPCGPGSQRPAAMVHLTAAYSESFFLERRVEPSQADCRTQAECRRDGTGSSLDLELCSFQQGV